MRCRRIDLNPRRDLARPFDEQGHANAALKVRNLPTPKGRVNIGKAHISRTAVVTRENYDGVIREALLFQCRHNATDTAIQRSGHSRIHPQSMGLDVAHGLIIGPRSLQWRMNSPVGQI